MTNNLAPRLKVMKFGGTSVADGAAIRRVAALVAADAAPAKVVVVSAPAGVTNDLARALDDGDVAEAVAARWSALAAGLLGDATFTDSMAATLRADLAAAFPAPERHDLVLSHGERVSAALTAAYFREKGMDAVPVDARKVIVTDGRAGGAKWLPGATASRARDVLMPLAAAGKIAVVTGFIAADAGGRTTLLGRGGSDLTATILGAVLGADVVEIWSDADGVMTADPRVVAEAARLERLSYEEAVELAHSGAKIIYSRSLLPALRAGVPLHIRNTFNPASPGTWVGATSSPANFALASQGGVTVVTVANPEMIDTPGFLAALFRAFESHGLSVDVVAVAEASVSATVHGLAAEREPPLRATLAGYGDVSFTPERSVIAVVSARLRDDADLVPRLLRAAAAAGVRVEVISHAYGSLNLSLVVASERAAEAVRVLHAALNAAPPEESACRNPCASLSTA